MNSFYAQPYDISANGFYFETEEEFRTKSAALRNDYGDPVEEFEIQFIDGEMIDAEVCKAIGINQANIFTVIEKLDEWDEDDKRTIIIAVGEGGYSFDLNASDPSIFDIEIYKLDSMRELAEQFVDEGLFGEIPDRLAYYLDYDAIARDLAIDYCETTIDGQNLIYRMD
ncbi:antirestriction protein ArdA [Cohaesibacter celericrescens]|uniref:Antirestriction protein ArdA n=1 Tax=Cohaesibacter celericrescens TaxID=2067669 RepID=A0A2N5XPG9_9HYPH|nr:antirestriction protein ArdA [Cohaesibacter celericrescens]PLW76431.1 antirestriction protein ArdA [Cohaesibacter celericrescens]